MCAKPHGPPGKLSDYPYKWDTTTVVHILERREYTGCTVNFKTYTNSIWDKKKQRKTPEDERTVFYDTQPAVITEEVFEKVQQIRPQRQAAAKHPHLL